MNVDAESIKTIQQYFTDYVYFIGFQLIVA